MTISDKPEMLFQCECFLKSLALKNYNFTLVINGIGNKKDILFENKNLLIEFKKRINFKKEFDIVFSSMKSCDHPPVRWFIEPKSEVCVFVDSDVLFCELTENDIDHVKKFDISAVMAYENPFDKWDDCLKLFGINNLNFLTSYTKEACPFYPNYGVLFVNANKMKIIGQELIEVMKNLKSSKFGDNKYFAQIALAVASEKLNLKKESLPIRFNYTDKFDLDEKEKQQMKFFHYLSSKNIFFNKKVLLKNKNFFDYKIQKIIHKILNLKFL